MASDVKAPAEITFNLIRFSEFPNAPMIVHNEKGIPEKKVDDLFKSFGCEIGRVLSLTKSKLVFKGELRRFNPESVSATVIALKTLWNERNMLKVREEILAESTQHFGDSFLLDHERDAIAKTRTSIATAEQALEAAQQTSGITVTLEQAPT